MRRWLPAYSKEGQSVATGAICEKPLKLLVINGGIFQKRTGYGFCPD
jgi:hypothetical protein